MTIWYIFLQFGIYVSLSMLYQENYINPDFDTNVKIKGTDNVVGLCVFEKQKYAFVLWRRIRLFGKPLL
jgi:hypothetical protein